jgi:uncharacterized protein involved in exopolysaccharide biosynthesis
MVISAAGGCLFLWLITPVYRASGSFKLEDTQSELGALAGFSGSKNLTLRTATESQVIRSREMIRRALQFIDWKVSFYLGADRPENELYPRTPFQVQIIRQDKTFFTNVLHIRFANTAIYLRYSPEEAGPSLRVKPGEPVRLPGIVFTLSRTQETKMNTDYTIRFNPTGPVTDRIATGISVDEPSKFSSLITISITDHNPAFAADAVNALMRQYMEDDRNQRLSFCLGVIHSADRRLNELYRDTKRSADKILSYQRRHSMNDPSLSRIVPAEGSLQLLEHDHAVNQRIVDFLLEKKLTAAIAMQASMPGAVLVDPAVEPTAPLYPRRKAVFRSVILIGLIMGTGTGIFFPHFLSLHFISRCLKQYR